MDKPWIIVQYDNRVIEEKYLKLIDINKKYCLKYGYDYILETKEYDIPPWWVKVRLVKDLLETNKYKGALWLDTDAVIHNHDMPLDSLLIEGKSMYYSPDCPRWDGKLNAGVWLIINDTKGNEIIEKWMNSYSSGDWKKTDNKWSSLGSWAGSTYEQGAFLEFVQPHFKENIQLYPWKVLQSYEFDIHTFTMHFAGELSDEYLPTYLKNKIENFCTGNIYYGKVLYEIFLLLIICIVIIFFTYVIHSNSSLYKLLQPFQKIKL